MFKLSILDNVAFKDAKFPDNSLAVWLPYADHQALAKQIDHNGKSPLFVQIVCREPLKPFTIFVNAQAMHKDSNPTPSTAFIHQNALPGSVLQNRQATVTITPVKVERLSLAQSITIDLKPNEVATWSEEEIDFAKESIKLTKIFYKGQPIVIKSGTKKPTIGIITKVYPNNSQFEACGINSETVINLNGLPENKQKTIDFTNIGGLDEIVSGLREIIQIPLVFPGLLKRFNINPPRGLILHGPPGNGKTMIARSIAHSLGAKFIAIQGPELISKYAGESERELRAKFDEAYAAGNSVIFIDELDSIAGNRDKTTAEHIISMVSTLLNLMDGMSSSANIFVIGATNRLNSIDPALRRPGRFELEYLVPIPNLNARHDILTKTLKLEQSSNYNNVDSTFVTKLSQITNGYSGADLVSLHRQSVMRAIRRNLSIDNHGKVALTVEPEKIQVSQEDFLESYKKITPTSVRSYESSKQPVLWDNLLGLFNQKSYLENLHNLISKKSFEFGRPSFLNIAFLGDRGSSRSTLAHSFAKQFNYEIITFDLLNFPSLEFGLLLEEIKDTIKTCKQISPSVLYFKNIEQCERQQNLMAFIASQLDNLNGQDIVLAIIECRTRDFYDSISGYKLFNECLDFSKISDSDQKNAYEYLGQKFNEKQVYHLIFDKKLPLGQVIHQLEEDKLREN